MSKINQWAIFYPRIGVWFYFFGSLISYFSIDFIHSGWNAEEGFSWFLFLSFFSLVIGLLFVLFDPFFLLYRQTKNNLQKRQPYIAWSFAIIAFICFLLRLFLDSSALTSTDKLGGVENSFLSKFRTVLLFVFLSAYVVSFIYRLLFGFSYSSVTIGLGGFATHRQNYFKKSILSILSVLLFVVLVNYLTNLRNPSIDLSPGLYSFEENSRGVIRSLKEKINIYAFLPELQAVTLRKSGFTSTELYKVASDVRLFLEQLKLVNPNIHLKFYNADLEAYNSNEFGGINNGTIVFRSTKKNKTISFDPNEKSYIERRVYVSSKKDLPHLERNITKALVYVASPKRKIYFTTSNGERYNTYGGRSRSLGIESFKEQLRFYNMKLEELDQKSGWPSKKIPTDADALLVIGATTPFGKKAQLSIQKYLKAGGALFLAIDPVRGSEDYSWLLNKMGGKQYKLSRFILTNTNLNGVLISDNFENHPITESIQKQFPSIALLPQQAYFMEKTVEKTVVRGEAKSSVLEDAKKKKQNKGIIKKQSIKSLRELTNKIIFHSPYNSFSDVNRNGRKDSKEKSGRQVLALSYEKEGLNESPKVVIFSGIDWLTERGIRFPVAHQNFLLATDSLFWLLESSLTGTYKPVEGPQKIQMTAFLKWKFLVIGMILFPILVGVLLASGLFLYRRKRTFSEISQSSSVSLFSSKKK